MPVSASIIGFSTACEECPNTCLVEVLDILGASHHILSVSYDTYLPKQILPKADLPHPEPGVSAQLSSSMQEDWVA